MASATESASGDECSEVIGDWGNGDGDVEYIARIADIGGYDGYGEG